MGEWLYENGQCKMHSFINLIAVGLFTLSNFDKTTRDCKF